MNPFTLAALVGGAALVLANVLLLLDPDARELDTAADYVTVGILVAGTLLAAAGLVALHLRQREAYGVLGLIGFALAFVGQVAAVATVYRANVVLFLLTIVPGVVGLVLLTFAIARAPVLPAWSGLLLLLGFIALVIVGDADLGIAFAGAVWLVIGYALRSELRLTASSAA